MIVLNELEFAEKMSKCGFIKQFSIFELSIYAKWLKFLGKENADIENSLIAFSKKHYCEFNYQIHFDKIDKAMKSIEMYALRIPIKTVVTKAEWKSIFSVDNEKYRRVLFVMLVLSKYYKNNSTKILSQDSESAIDAFNANMYCCWLSDYEVCKIAKVSFKPILGRNEMFSYLRDVGLVDIYSKKNTYRFLNFINDDSDVLIEISDYDDIILYYERQIGEKVSECKQCGRLFKQNKMNNLKYCKEHRGYKKIGRKNILCSDCGKEFDVDGAISRKTRCNDCQKKHDKKRYAIYRQKNKSNK